MWIRKTARAVRSNLLKDYTAKPFFAWQIELTSRCPLKCRMCAKEGSGDWRGCDMDISNFKKLVPYFKETEHVILQGWGEPLLYKDLIEAVRIVKTQGAKVGFVTSGTGMNKHIMSELICSDVDFIGFSFAGATSKTHNSIRLNSDLGVLLDNIRVFNEIKAEKKLNKPGFHIVFLLLKDNVSETPALIKLAKDIGIDNIILTNLIHITNEWQEEQRIFTCSDSSVKDYHEILKEAETKAKELKINLRLPSLSSTDVSVCEENPLRNFYISVDGEVSPCVYLYPPCREQFKRIFCGKEHLMEKLSFGNIFRGPFSSIWNSKAYAEFRNCFRRRQKEFKKVHSAPLPPPAQCSSCHKMLGV